jgi:hypothetical protein
MQHKLNCVLRWKVQNCLLDIQHQDTSIFMKRPEKFSLVSNVYTAMRTNNH